MDEAARVEEEISFTVATFVNTIRSNQMRLRKALRNREETHQLLERGEGRDTYRGKLIVDGVMRIFDTLEEIASEFNQANPDDLCTSKDFGDILLSAISTLQKS